MKTLKPLQLGILHRCFEHLGRKLLGVSVLAGVTLDEGPTLLLEAELWQFLGEALGKDSALEVGIPKVVSEFLVFGSAYVPDGQQSSAIAVRARLGSADKILHVFGDRQWNGRQPTEPVPFSAMPLDWSRAFGGPGFAANPLGKGRDPIEIDGRRVHPLPNIEYPSRKVRSPTDDITPAGFGLIDLTWPQRAELVGTYDDTWLKTRFPGYPDDIDWRHFNVAPRDQWLDHPIGPDESYELTHLHPTRRQISGRLPGIIGRAFVNRQTANGLTLEEVPLVLRTAAFFPDRERVLLIYQGVIPIADEQAADIAHVVIGADAASAPRRPDEYRAVLERRLDKDKGAFHALRDRDLTPPGMRLGALVERQGSEDPSLERALQRAENEIGKARTMVAGYGLDPDKHAPMIPARRQEPVPALEDVPEFIDKKLAEAEAMAAEQKEWARRQDESLAAVMKGAGQDFGLILKERTQGPTGPPRFSAKAELDELRQLAQRMRSLGQPVAELDAYVADAKLEARLRYGEQQIQAAYRLTAHHQAPAPRMDPEAAARLKELLVADYRARRSLAGRDLTGADLSGLDLRGADLSGVLLESADLRGACLDGCDLSGAVLARAELTGVALNQANLVGANLGRANLDRASLREAKLADAILVEADLSGAVLTGAELAGADLTNATFGQTDLSGVMAPDMVFKDVNLTGVILRSAVMHKNVFINCTLANADFSGADLSGSAFLGVRAARASFNGARLVRCCFVAPSDLSGADFSHADLSFANLRDARLPAARFESAVLRGGDLSGADLGHSLFYLADARDARFVKADLSQAVVVSANLMNAVLERAVLRGADLRYANLFQADLARVKLDSSTRLDGVLIKKARTYPRLSYEEMRA